MIWLIGNRGMLETEVEELLQERKMDYFASDKELDITNKDQLEEFISDKPLSWIINCSAYTAVDKAEDEPELAFQINAYGPLHIAKIARNKRAKLIHVSTDYVFDGTREEAYTETDIPNPISVYGTSKYQGEINIQKTVKEFFLLRTSWLYGKNGVNFVYTMLRLFKERNEVSVLGDQWGSPTYAPDLAEVLLKIVHLNSESYGIYHFTNEGKTTWYDFACEINRISQKKGLLTKEVRIQRISSEDYPSKAKRPHNSFLSKNKITQTFNLYPRNWEAALDEFMLSITMI